MKEKIKFIKENWKLGLHILLRTKRFGVNNQWWSEYDSIFGHPLSKIIYSIILIYPLYRNYKMMKIRARCGFMTGEEYKIFWKDKL
jgi:hypothetical protein